MNRGGRNGQQGGRGGGRGGGANGQQGGRGGGNNAGAWGAQQQRGGDGPSAWPSLGGPARRQPPSQAQPTAAAAPPAAAAAAGGSWRGNNNGVARPIDGNSNVRPQQQQQPQQRQQPAWPGLPQGNNNAQPTSAWQTGNSNGARNVAAAPAATVGNGNGNVNVPRPLGAAAAAAAIGGAAERIALREAGGGAADAGRGTTRGRRPIPDADFYIKTKPAGLPTKQGTSGRQVTVQSNYFLLSKRPEWSIHQYRIDFSPDVEQRFLRRAYLNHHHQLFGGLKNYIFDGTVLFTMTFLREAREAPLEVCTKNREGETILIKIKHVGIVDCTDMQVTQVFNLIIRGTMEGLNLQLLGRNYFDPAAKNVLRQYNLEIWPGYITSIRQHERDLLLCCEIAHKVMRTDTLYQILMQCRNERDLQDAFKRKVIGMIVLTNYNNKTYRIDDVDFQSNPTSTFPKRDGSQMSYIDYYRQHYNITIRDRGQPLLISRPRERDVRGGVTEPIKLIPELSVATGITDEMRSDFRLMRAMSEFTRLRPNDRIARLQRYNSRMQDTKQNTELLNGWQMKLDRNLIELPARVLQPGRILFGNGGSYTCSTEADWTREFRGKKMLIAKRLDRWCVILPERSAKEVQNFVQMVMKTGMGLGMSIAMPHFKEMPDDRSSSYNTSIDDMANRDVQLMMVVLTRQNEEKYSCVKKKCCVDRPVPSQVCTLTTIAPRAEKARGLMSIATKVAIQMNAKLGGLPWNVEMQVKDSIMFIGFDVCHSAKDKNQSIGALVATMDQRTSQKYYSTVRKHLKGQELSNQIMESVTEALHEYKNEHNSLPDRIIFYRDGVGDGQLHHVFELEVKVLTKKLEQIYNSLKLRLRFAFIVVSKRINTRYFCNGNNPDPGTVVDDVITMPDRYDFFLVSQSVNQGTVSPTSYNIIHDTTGFSADSLQKITYAQTHMYFNWSGTCRVPAVCQYAHKCAALVAESIHSNPHRNLSKQLYFL